MTQLNSYFGNLAQCKNHSALLIRSLKNVWKKKLIFVKLKCISKVTFPISHEQERQSKKAAIISLQEHRWPHTDSSSCLIAVISEWGIPRASLVRSPSNITPHCTTVNWTLHCTLHCSVEQLELSSSWWLRDSSENSSWNPGMSRTVSLQVDASPLRRPKEFPVDKPHGFQKRVNKKYRQIYHTSLHYMSPSPFWCINSGHRRKPELRFDNLLRKRPVPWLPKPCVWHKCRVI